MYVFMKHFMNKLVFGWSKRGVRLRSLLLSPSCSSRVSATGGSVKRGFCLTGDFLSSQTGLLQSCLGEEGEMESEGGRGGGGWGGLLHCTTQRYNKGGGLWIYLSTLVLHLNCVWTRLALHV